LTSPHKADQFSDNTLQTLFFKQFYEHRLSFNETNKVGCISDNLSKSPRPYPTSHNILIPLAQNEPLWTLQPVANGAWLLFPGPSL
jgi:hypothetical protein